MTILSAKDNPPSKSFTCSILEKEGTWWIAKVKPRQEKAFAFDLMDQCVDYYLPYYEKKTRRTDGKCRKSYLVLFPSYVPFIANDPYEYLKRDRIVTVLPVRSQDRFRTQLNCIEAAFDSGHEILALENTVDFIVGSNIKIASGPCSGLSGQVVKTPRSNYLKLDVEGLGYVLINILETLVLPAN